MLYNSRGLLIPGIFEMNWEQLESEYSFSSKRVHLLTGLKRALLHLKSAGCEAVYIDGSFVTRKVEPNDYDACWDTQGVDPNKVDTMFLAGLKNGTEQQKIVYYGEFFPMSCVEKGSGLSFIDFFQTDKTTGNRKGIIKIPLGTIQ